MTLQILSKRGPFLGTLLSHNPPLEVTSTGAAVPCAYRLLERLLFIHHQGSSPEDISLEVAHVRTEACAYAP